jgi:hypothetical protein
VDLRWWPVALAGSACLVAVVALAALLSITAARRHLRPLANVARLTRLPEYAKVARLRSLSTIVTLVVLTVMFAAATWAAARPSMARNDFDAAHPEDIMLCVAQPVTDSSAAELLDYFARRSAASPSAQRVGLTSANRRVVPLTRDHQYAATRFGEYLGVAATSSAAFAPAVPYTDYAANVNDVLALCLSGFPAEQDRGTHRRSVIYLGPSELRAPGERRATLFTDASVERLAERAAAQVDVIDTAPSPASNTLKALTEQTGGRYTAAGSTTVTAAVHDIRSHAPRARRADGTLVTADVQDAPAVPLAIALFCAAVLSVALLVLRR